MPRPCTICVHPDRETIDQQLRPEAHEQFIEAIEVMRDYREKCLPAKGIIRDDVHLLSGEAALPKPVTALEGASRLQE